MLLLSSSLEASAVVDNSGHDFDHDVDHNGDGSEINTGHFECYDLRFIG